MEINLSHGSPADRGSADAYYGREFNPHKNVDNVRVNNLTKDEIAAYTLGFVTEPDRKNFN